MQHQLDTLRTGVTADFKAAFLEALTGLQLRGGTAETHTARPAGLSTPVHHHPGLISAAVPTPLSHTEPVSSPLCSGVQNQSTLSSRSPGQVAHGQQSVAPCAAPDSYPRAAHPFIPSVSSLAAQACCRARPRARPCAVGESSSQGADDEDLLAFTILPSHRSLPALIGARYLGVLDRDLSSQILLPRRALSDAPLPVPRVRWRTGSQISTHAVVKPPSAQGHCPELQSSGGETVSDIGRQRDSHASSSAGAPASAAASERIAGDRSQSGSPVTGLGRPVRSILKVTQRVKRRSVGFRCDPRHLMYCLVR